jgi:hypothetical protein
VDGQTLFSPSVVDGWLDAPRRNQPGSQMEVEDRDMGLGAGAAGSAACPPARGSLPPPPPSLPH